MDILWQYRLSNYIKTLDKLSDGVHWVTQQVENYPNGIIHPEPNFS